MRGCNKLFAALRLICSILPPLWFCLLGGSMLLPLGIAVFLHECAHIAVLKAFGGRLCGFSAAPFGLRLTFDESSLSLRAEAAVTSAGSVVNLLCFAASLILYRWFEVDLLNFGIVSLLTALLNLLPMYPLDGGRLLYLLVAWRKNPDFAELLVAAVTDVFCLAVFLISSYLLLTAQKGLYAVFFSMYIFTKNAPILAASIIKENRGYQRISKDN